MDATFIQGQRLSIFFPVKCGVYSRLIEWIRDANGRTNAGLEIGRKKQSYILSGQPVWVKSGQVSAQELLCWSHLEPGNEDVCTMWVGGEGAKWHWIEGGRFFESPPHFLHTNLYQVVVLLELVDLQLQLRLSLPQLLLFLPLIWRQDGCRRHKPLVEGWRWFCTRFLSGFVRRGRMLVTWSWTWRTKIKQEMSYATQLF